MPRLDTAALYERAFTHTSHCVERGEYIASTILCFGLHEGMAYAMYSIVRGAGDRFKLLATLNMNWTGDQAVRMWKARCGVVHSFGHRGNANLLEPTEEKGLQHLAIEKGQIIVRPDKYLAELKNVFDMNDVRESIASARQFKSK